MTWCGAYQFNADLANRQVKNLSYKTNQSAVGWVLPILLFPIEVAFYSGSIGILVSHTVKATLWLTGLRKRSRMQTLSPTTKDTQQHCSICKNYSNCWAVLDLGGSPGICESYVKLSIEVFQTLNQPALQFLKDFLTGLPTPLCIEQVLLQATRRLAENDSAACCWLLSHREDLKPELDLVAMVQQCATEKLFQKGCVVSRDFHFLEEGKLGSNDLVKTILLDGTTPGDRLLFTEILKL